MSDAIESILHEDRKFAPSAEFSSQALISSEEQYNQMWQQAKEDPETFWGELARTELDWFQPFETTMAGEMPETKWFLGGKINASYQCLDRHLTTTRKNKAAIIWEGEPGDTRTLTYQQLHHEVCKFANVLKTLGVEAGDRITLYMPMVPELAIAMLACARVGATHSIIFGGFSADAIADRNNDAESKLVITADGGWRRGKRSCPQSECRRLARAVSIGRESGRVAPHRRRCRNGPRSRLLVARSDGTRLRRL